MWCFVCFFLRLCHSLLLLFVGLALQLTLVYTSLCMRYEGVSNSSHLSFTLVKNPVFLSLCNVYVLLRCSGQCLQLLLLAELHPSDSLERLCPVRLLCLNVYCLSGSPFATAQHLLFLVSTCYCMLSATWHSNLLQFWRPQIAVYIFHCVCLLM